MPGDLLIGVGVVLALYAVLVLVLVLTGRRSQAAEVARFVPDCAVLLHRLVRDPRVPRRDKLLLGALAAYLAFPLDLVPDVIPVAGQLDDAILVALVLRRVLRAGGNALVREHWPGTEGGLQLVLRLGTRDR